MAADATPGTKGNPRFLGSGAPATAVDFNLVSDWAADNIDVAVANEAALPATGNWVGRRRYVTDIGADAVHDGTGWRLRDPQIHGRVQRSATATTFPASYTNVGTNTFWSANTADGITAYNGGWTIPLTGVYDIGYEMRADAAFLAGIAVNYTGTAPTLVLAATAQPVQGIAALTISGKLRLTAGDIIRPYLLAASGTPNWVASAGFFDVAWARRV